MFKRKPKRFVLNHKHAGRHNKLLLLSKAVTAILNPILMALYASSNNILHNVFHGQMVVLTYQIFPMLPGRAISFP